MQRRTRRSASTIGGAAPDTIIGRAVADRAGARPCRANALRKSRRNVPLHQGFFAETQSIHPHSGSNPQHLTGQQRKGEDDRSYRLAKCRSIFSFRNRTDSRRSSMPFMPSSIEIQEENPTEFNVEKILS